MKRLPVMAAAVALMFPLLCTPSFAADAAAAKPAQKAEAPALSPDAPVATVNGRPITQSFFNKVLEQAPGGEGQTVTPDMKRQLLDRLVDFELTAQAAEKQGLDKTPDFMQGMDFVRKQQLYSALVKSEIIDKVKVTPEEVKAYYDGHKDEFNAEEEVKASHILVDTEDEAKKIKARLDKGEDFAAIAKASSKCPSSAKGGDLGFFGKGRMVPEFEKAAFALKVGEISAPVKTQFGWHIIKVTEKKEAGTKALDDVKTDLEQKLLQEKQKKTFDDMLAKLKSDAKIEINETALQGPEKPAAPAAAEAPAPAGK